MLKTLKDLCLLPGVSSYEDPVRDYIRARAEKAGCTCRVDAMGSLICEKKGKTRGKHKLMLAAHMDEVGFLISSITDDGYLKFGNVGGIDTRVIIGKRVKVGWKGLPGVIGLKAYHLVSEEEEKKVPKREDLYIDIGCQSREEAEALVELGDFAVFDSDFVKFGRGLLKGKAIDDRVGCAVMVKLLETDLPQDVTFAFTVQEEVGLRGAYGAAFSVTPDIGLVLEGTTAADLPGMQEHKKVTRVGHGPAISLMDNASIHDRELAQMLMAEADQAGIPWQLKNYFSGGNDAGAIQRTKTGARVLAMSAPVRYLHAPSSVVSAADCEHMLVLAEKFIAAVSRL